MDTIGKKIQAKRERIDAIKAQLADLERELAVTRAELEAYQEARDFYNPPSQQTKQAKPTATSDAQRTARALTGVWLETMRGVGDKPTFGVDDLVAAASALGHHPTKDNIRSQIFNYKTRGIVEALEPGVYQFTAAGREALGLSASRAENEKTPH